MCLIQVAEIIKKKKQGGESGKIKFSITNLIFRILPCILTLCNVIILLKPSLENFEHSLLACEMSAIVWLVEHSLALSFFGIGKKTDLFQSCGYC